MCSLDAKSTMKIRLSNHKIVGIIGYMEVIKWDFYCEYILTVMLSVKIFSSFISHYFAICFSPGTVPEWLKGQIIYNGPGLTKVGQNEYRHAFDASALLQK